MRDQWLKKYKIAKHKGEWQFTGSITAADKTVVTPQAKLKGQTMVIHGLIFLMNLSLLPSRLSRI